MKEEKEMKKFKRVIALLLVVCMLAGTALNTSAAQTTNAELSEKQSEQVSTTAVDEDFMRILHLDNGRKYFTKDWIIALINEMEAAGYNQLQLAFGNDGMRFLLDDMSVTVNGTTYSSQNVTAGIKQGNKNYYNAGDVNELSQAEMTAIVNYAKSKGIAIIPHMNMPGHMDAILDAIEYVGISDAHFTGDKTSVRSLNLNNDRAVAFTLALLEKYVAYFKELGCEYFHIGADEFGNDAYYNGMGFPNMGADLYTKFAKFVDDAAGIVTNAGMTPRAWNDGISYQGYNDEFDSGIQITYWSGGWGGYNPASSSTLKNNGHDMINTHGDYYFILTNEGITNPSDKALDFNNNVFASDPISDPVGSMFCIWCDAPGSATEQQVAEAVRITLRKMAASMKGTDSYSEEVVSGGFNVDGSIAETREWNTVFPTGDSNTQVSGYELTSVDVKEMTGTQVPSVEGAKNVKAWDITPYAGNAKYTERGTVSLPVPEDWTNVRGGVLASESGEAVSDITGTLKDGVFTFNVPHFSTVYVYELDTTAVVPDETINLEVGSTHEIVIKNVDYDGAYATDPAGIATVVAEFKAGEGSSEIPVTAVTAGESYYLKNDAGQYMKEDATFTGEITEAAKWTLVTSTNGYMIHNENNQYLFYENGWILFDGWGDDFKFSNGKLIDYYVASQSLIPVSGGGTVNQSTITFTGIAPGTTYATVGDTVYKIVVTGKVNITIKYVDANGTVIKTETAQVADNATTYNVSNFNHNGKYYVVNNKVLNITPSTVSEYTVTVEETAEDLSAVTPLEIEYWQTNSVVVETFGGTNNSKTINAQETYSEEGIVLTDIIPMTGYKVDAGVGDPALGYWRSRLLSLPGNQQTGENGDDETLNGTGFTKVRYWNGSWSVYTDAGNWQDIDPNAYQLVAYYMNDMNLADEVKVSTSDWGKKGNGEYGGTYLGSNNVSLVFQVVYEDGTTAPADETAASLAPYTYFVDAWGNRGVGTVAINQIGDYQIWKVTAETGEHNAIHNGNYLPVTLNSFAWDNNEMTVWEGDPVSQYTILNPANNPNTEGYYDNLRWNETNESILIRIYIKAEKTEDSLNVVYYDEKFGDTLYEYNISVPSGSNFNDNIVNLSNNNVEDPKEFKDNPARVDVTGYGIVNALEKTQNFQTNLTLVPEAVGKYNSGLYKYTGSVISEDGKTLYLYYNISTEVLSPMFVADYGRPFTFNLSQVVGNNQGTMVKDVTVNEKTRYGTLEYNATSEQFTYTPTQVLPNIDVLTINIRFDGDTTFTTTNAGVMPATTVDYEEGFATLTGFTGGSKGTSMQNAWVAGTNPENDVYGYDSKVVSETNTKAVSTAKGNTAVFSFTGTGVDLYINSTGDSGNIAVQVRNAENKLVKILSIQTTSNSTITGNFSDTEQRGLIAGSVQGLAYGQYTVKVTTTNDAAVYFDGFRVYGTLQDQANDYYKADLEDEPMFLELRDYVLAAMNVSSEGSVYEDIIENANAVYEQILNSVNVGEGSTLTSVVLGDANRGYSAQELLDNGPKNELFLLPGQTVVFKVNTNREVQVGLKAVNGTSNVTGTIDKTVSTERDMFYTVKDKTETVVESTITITNASTSNSILSITKVKICDDPNAVFGELEASDLVEALETLGFKTETLEPDPEPTPVYADAKLNLILADYNGNTISNLELTSNGEEGKEATFTAEEIKEAVLSAIPDNYAVVDIDAIVDQIIAYGESADIEIQVGKVATLTVTYVKEVNNKGNKKDKKNNKKEEVIGTATLTAVQTSRSNSYTFTVSEIKAAAPDGFKADKVSNVKVKFGETKSLKVKSK